jgi:cytoskeletal protein CcmA (bactofilin family)
VTGAVQAGMLAVAERVRVEGGVRGNVYALSETFTVEREGSLGSDATLFGQQAELEGSVARDVVFGGMRLELVGSVGRDLHVLHAHRLLLLEGARVGGDLDALLPEEVEIELAEGATVGGEVTKRSHSHAEAFFARFRAPHFYLLLVVELVAAFAFGVVLYALAPALFASSVPTAGAFLRALGWGLVALVAAPVAIGLTALTVVGIPIAVLGLFGYLTALYLADVVVGALIGRALLEPEAGLGAFARALLVGLAIVVAGHAIPFLGAAVGVVSLLLGLGLLVERARHFRPLRA